MVAGVTVCVVLLVVTDVSVDAGAAALAGCGWRIGTLMPEGSDTTGCAAGAALVAAGVAVGVGELSAGCVSTTHPDAATSEPIKASVFIEWLFTICLTATTCSSQHIAN